MPGPVTVTGFPVKIQVLMDRKIKDPVRAGKWLKHQKKDVY
jgi:hypothetical protein